MEWYFKLSIYLIGIIASMFALWQVDFSRFMRRGKNEMAIFVWLIVSVALGYLIGSIFIEVGTLLQDAKS